MYSAALVKTDHVFRIDTRYHNLNDELQVIYCEYTETK